ncbi:MAG: energy-coupling factor transporter transmembrane component T family protein [Thermoplasmata archaeon]
MSRRSYSKHIPDFRLVTYFAESRDSMVHRMNPWTKGVLLIFTVGLVTVLTDVWILLSLLLLSIVFYAGAKLPLGVLIGWWTLPVIFVITLTVMFMFTEPGEQLAVFDVFGERISVTDNGIMLVVKLLVRALAVVNVSLTLFMTTRYAHIAHMAFRTLPKTLANMFLLSYRFMFETSDEISEVLDAMHSRSGSLAKGLTRQTKTFAGIFGLSFVHAFERAERIAKAMEARGFAGRFPSGERVPLPSYGGCALIALAAAVFAIATYSRYFASGTLGW